MVTLSSTGDAACGLHKQRLRHARLPGLVVVVVVMMVVAVVVATVMVGPVRGDGGTGVSERNVSTPRCVQPHPRLYSRNNEKHLVVLRGGTLARHPASQPASQLTCPACSLAYLRAVAEYGEALRTRRVRNVPFRRNAARCDATLRRGTTDRFGGTPDPIPALRPLSW